MSGVELGIKKLLNIGPSRPCGSSTKGRSIMLLLRRSPMDSSPKIDSEGSVLLCLFLRRNFFRSNSRRCESAWAVIVFTSNCELVERNGLLLLPIVISAPIVVYGHCVVVVSESIGSGSKLISKGWADMSRVRRCCRSVSSFEDGRM